MKIKKILKMVKIIFIALGITACVLPVSVIIMRAALFHHTVNNRGWEIRISEVSELPGMHEILNDYDRKFNLRRSTIGDEGMGSRLIDIDIHLRVRADEEVLEEVQERLFEYFVSNEFFNWIEEYGFFFYFNHEVQPRTSARREFAERYGAFVSLTFHNSDAHISTTIFINYHTREVEAQW